MAWNWFFVGIATISGFIWSEFWYSSACLGNRFLYHMEKTKLDLKNPTRLWLLSLFAVFIYACLLEAVIVLLHFRSIIIGLAVGGGLGMVMVLSVMIPDYFRSEWKRPLFWINAGYRVSVSILIGGILAWLH